MGQHVMICHGLRTYLPQVLAGMSSTHRPGPQGASQPRELKGQPGKQLVPVPVICDESRRLPCLLPARPEPVGRESQISAIMCILD
jgi:hypothetical protein